jgi:hypothetical protein
VISGEECEGIKEKNKVLKKSTRGRRKFGWAMVYVANS